MKSLNFAFFMSILLALSSCAPSRDVKRKLTTRDLTAYEQNSCTFKFEEGGNVRNNLNNIDIVQTYFGKFYDQAQVIAVLNASAKKTVEYMTAHDVAVYGVFRKSKGCHNLSSLPQVNGELLNFWNLIDGGEQGPFVLGLFLPAARATAYGINKPLIVVRTDADRWTLIHEFMHFLYADYRDKRDRFDEMAFLNTWRTMNQDVAPKLNSFSVAQAKADVNYRESMAQMFLEYSRTARVFLKNFPLEEMSIESILFDFMEKNMFPGSTAFNRNNSFGYIHQNYVKASLLMKDLVTVGQAIQSTYGDAGGSYKYLKSELANVQNLSGAALSLRSKKYPLPNMTLAANELHDHSALDCGHSQMHADIPFRLLAE